MVVDADKVGTQVTVQNDARITKIGEKLRKYRIDEIPQLINIILGDMTFVGDSEIIGTTKKNLDFTRVLAA